MRDYEAHSLAATINGDYPDWEATVERDAFGFYQVVAEFEEGGIHRLNLPSDWEDVKALIYDEDDD